MLHCLILLVLNVITISGRISIERVTHVVPSSSPGFWNWLSREIFSSQPQARVFGVYIVVTRFLKCRSKSMVPSLLIFVLAMVVDERELE